MTQQRSRMPRFPSLRTTRRPIVSWLYAPAEKSIVLLKNDHILPLQKSAKIAVIGPNAASLAAIEGNYNAVPSQPVLPLAGMENAFGANRYSTRKAHRM